MAARMSAFKKPNPKPKMSEEKRPGKKRKRSSSSESDNTDSTDTSGSSSEEDQLLATAKWSHNKKAKCRMSGCKAVVGDLWSHLRTHVKKDELKEEDVEKALAIMYAGKSQRGPRIASKKKEDDKPGRFKKWCPQDGCTTIMSKD